MFHALRIKTISSIPPLLKLTINFKQILTSAILLAATGYVAARSEMRPSHYVADGN